MIEKKSTETAYVGFTLAPSLRWKDELALTCSCGSQCITLSIEPGKYGSGKNGAWRMGDYGGKDYAKCNKCNAIAYHKNNKVSP